MPWQGFFILIPVRFDNDSVKLIGMFKISMEVIKKDLLDDAAMHNDVGL